MALWPLTFEIIITFVLTASLLYRYGNWATHNVIVTVSVFIAWFFAFLVIFVLPLDISTTTYRQCLADSNHSQSLDNITVQYESNVTTTSPIISNITEPYSNSTTVLPLNVTTEAPVTFSPSTEAPDGSETCQQPWSYVPGRVLPTLWRIVYWSGQVLTWLILPMMQSYSMAGDFTVLKKIRSSFIENIIYYGSFAVIFVILVIYVAVRGDLSIANLKVIGITASNTWGLILLVILLGYGLIEIPRSYIESSQQDRMLNYTYFKVAKLSAEKCEAEEKLDDALEEVQHAYESVISTNGINKQMIDIILEKCPPDWKNTLLNRMQSFPDRSRGNRGVSYNEKALVRLHQNVIRAMQAHHRTKVQWDRAIYGAVDCEDISKNQVNPSRNFKRTFPRTLPATNTVDAIKEALYTSRVEWYWKCIIRSPFYLCLGYFLTGLTFVVLWSELTFSITSHTFSVYALLIEFAKKTESYFFMEILSILSLAYLSICAFYTIFKIRVFNYYYLASHHMTDEYSLIFCGMLLCRLAPPLCLNYLGLIHLDSHITKVHDKLETYFTQIMGHMDVIPFISSGFNIYLPMLMCLFCLATFLQVGTRILHFVGIEQFITDDEMTSELVREGQDLVKREKNKRIKQVQTGANRDRWAATASRGQAVAVEPELLSVRSPQSDIIRSPTDDNARLELLDNVEPVDYSATWSTNRSNAHKPQRNLFDDI
ncbi:G-protein coupled receptor-associated protein LMBRD2 [Halotydeus destructor]|nr:G-protein coupled receptor-associated protein LMBRD2 [Halotydeus destructor]